MYRKRYVSSATELNYVSRHSSPEERTITAVSLIFPLRTHLPTLLLTFKHFIKYITFNISQTCQLHYVTLVMSTHQWIERSSFQHKDWCLLGCGITCSDISEKCVSDIRTSERLILMISGPVNDLS